MKQLFIAIILLVTTAALLWLLSIPLGKTPPLGKFFDPLSGFWRVAWQDDFPGQSEIRISGLQDNANVVFDSRGVPHIFADNQLDAFFAIGFIHARDRLWQMDIQYRFAVGRVAEVIGQQALDLDIRQRRLGLFLTAQEIVSRMDSTSNIHQTLKAYTRGVNYFINQLSYKDLPFEFKVLNYYPQPWTIEKTVLVNVVMGYLSRNFDDLYFSRLQKIFLAHDLRELYPIFRPSPYPIIPDKGYLNALILSESADLVDSTLTVGDFSASLQAQFRANEMGFGSNNWVIAGSKSVTGKPILASDPHLGLHIPSIWYEAHFVSPGFNTYGVTIPGAPYVIIGFNEKIAWGMTNCGWDVTDLYRETFDSDEKNRYLFNGEWHPVKKIRQVIHVKDGPDTTITLAYTHRGPLISLDNETYSLQWTGYDTLFTGLSIYSLNRAKNYQDYREALKSFNCPAQNFVYADVAGNIAITSAGKNPVRRSGFGRSIVDGRSDQYEWISYTPFSQLPHSLNPKQGYLASANQQPINKPDPYFGWNWASGYRAQRINELLKKHDKISVGDMKRFQTDAYSVRAEIFVPYILRAFENTNQGKRKARMDSLLFYLKSWTYHLKKSEVGATIFSEFMNQFRIHTWRDNFPQTNKRYMLPGETILKYLTEHAPDAKWFDDATTPQHETRDDIIKRSLLTTEKKLTEQLGTTISTWRWERYHKTQIPHLSNIGPLGVSPFPNNGGTGTLNVGPGRTNSFGPSWRMIVSLEQPIRAWGVYPGGQSGNPASKHYLDFLETWKNESYFKLWFPKSMSDLPDKTVESRLMLVSRRNNK